MSEVARTPDEIQEQHTEAEVWVTEGQSDMHGMTYEEGVKYALAWVLGDNDEPPIENIFDAKNSDQD